MGLWQLGRAHLLSKCVWSKSEKSLEILRHDYELNAGHREDWQWDAFILPLRHHDWHDVYATIRFNNSQTTVSAAFIIAFSHPPIHHPHMPKSQVT